MKQAGHAVCGAWGRFVLVVLGARARWPPPRALDLQALDGVEPCGAQLRDVARLRRARARQLVGARARDGPCAAGLGPMDAHRHAHVADHRDRGERRVLLLLLHLRGAGARAGVARGMRARVVVVVAASRAVVVVAAVGVRGCARQ